VKTLSYWAMTTLDRVAAPARQRTKEIGLATKAADACTGKVPQPVVTQNIRLAKHHERERGKEPQ
jgi:hypothetical protein